MDGWREDKPREIAMKQWRLYWSPTAQYIGTVEARTRRAAIRKSPKPYRKYLGEIYAELI